jgi:hypothetical protein
MSTTVNRDLTSEELAAAQLLTDLEQIVPIKVGDRVIFTLPSHTPLPQLYAFRSVVQTYLPGLDFVVITEAIQVSVLRAEAEDVA